MEHSTRSLFIKKVDLTSKNKESTRITPLIKGNNKCKTPKQPSQAYRGLQYQKDRQIEPVALPPKRTSTYEELLRRAKIRKFESRDKRLQEFQLKKKLQQEKRRHENECKRQQFLLNRERFKREQAEKLLEMEQRRRENRQYYRSYVEPGGMYKTKKNYNVDNGSSEGGVKSVHYRGKVEKKNLICSESTMSLYGVERNKYGELCATQPNDLESHKFRIYLPSKKPQKSGKPVPKPQPYMGLKCFEEMLTSPDQKANEKIFLKKPNVALLKRPSEDLVKPSYDRPTAMSVLNQAEEDAMSKRPKKVMSYKLSKSHLYAPSKLPLRHKKSKLFSQKKFVAFCECGRGLTESEAQLMGKPSSEAVSSTHEFHYIPVRETTCKVDNIYQDSNIPIRTPTYKTHNCKSDKNKKEGACSSSPTYSTVPTHKSNTSIKTVPSSRKTVAEAGPCEENTEHGIDVNSLNTKALQSNPIERTSTPVQCQESCLSQKGGSGEDDFSETFMCEETSLTGLMNVSSESPQVKINVAGEVVGVWQSHNFSEVTCPSKKTTKPEAPRIIKNRNDDEPLIVHLPCMLNHSNCHDAAADYSIQNTHVPVQAQTFNRRNQFAFADQASRSSRLKFHTSMEVCGHQPQIPCMVSETQYMILPASSQRSVYFPQHRCTVPFYNDPSWSPDGTESYAVHAENQPEDILASNNQEYDEVIILTAMSENMNNEIPILLFGFDETSPHNRLYSFGQSQHQLDSLSDMKIVEIQDNDNCLEDYDQTEFGQLKCQVCCKPQTNLNMDELEVSKACLHIRQIEMVSKEVTNHQEYKLPNSKASNIKQKVCNTSAISENQKANKESGVKQNNCCKSKKCHCGKRRKLSDQKENETFSHSSFAGPCNSMDITIDTFLLDERVCRICKKDNVGGKLEKHNSNVKSLSESSGKADTTFTHNSGNTSEDTSTKFKQPCIKNDHLRSQGWESENHVPLRSGPSDPKPNSSRYRQNKRLEHGKNPIKNCKCPNHSPHSPNHTQKLRPQNYTAQDSSESVEQSVQSVSKNSSSPTARSIQRKMFPIHKNNRDRLPHRRGGGQKMQRKVKKPKRKRTHRIATKQCNLQENESSTIFGLYEPTEYSVVSLFRNSTNAAALRANLLGIKRRYSYIITSPSSGSKRRGLNILSPDSTNLRAFPILEKRGENYTRHRKRSLSTISIYGSGESSFETRKFDNRLATDDPNSEKLSNTLGWNKRCEKCTRFERTEVNSHQHFFDHQSARGPKKWNDLLFAEACCLIIPMSLSSILKKVYSRTGTALIQISSNNVGFHELNFSHREKEPRLRGGGTANVPIYRNNQVVLLIRSLAVLKNFQEIVTSVSNQILIEEQDDLPIKHYLISKMIEKGNAALGMHTIELCNVMDELRKSHQGHVRLKAEDKFEKDIHDCLYKLKAKILLRTPVEIPEDLPKELLLDLEESIGSFQDNLLQKLNEICKDSMFSTLQYLYPTTKMSYSLQETLNYLGSIGSRSSLYECPLEILIFSNTLAKQLLKDFLM